MSGQQQGGNPVTNLIEGLKGLLMTVQNAAAAVQGQQPQEAENPYVIDDGRGHRVMAQQVVKDSVDSFQEEGDGTRLVRQYENGTTRTENVQSGVIMEERPDGSLYVSLAEGRLIHQAAPGEPILAYNSVEGGPPRIAQVSRVHLDPSSEPTVALHFEDEAGVHFVEIDTLRYYKLSKKQV